MITILHLEEVLNEKFIEVEQNTAEEGCTGTEEVILHFTNGKEILIFIKDVGCKSVTLVVEGD